MTNFSISFYVPIAINTLHYEPLFNADDKLEEFQEFLKEKTGLKWRFVEDINKICKNIELEFPFKIEFDQHILVSFLPNSEVFLSPDECAPYSLSNQKITFYLNENGTVILNYTALFTFENSISSKSLRTLHETIIDKFKQPEEHIKYLFEIGKKIKEALHEHTHGKAIHVEIAYTLCELFPWQYILFFFNEQFQTSNKADIADLIRENKSDVENISTHEVRQIFLSWHAGLIITEKPVEEDTYEVLAYSLLLEIICCLWQEMHLMNKLLLTETGQLLAAEPKKSNTRNLVRIRRIRALTETVLCRARAFRLHFSWEYINVIKTIYKKWFFDNIIESIINRRSTLDVVYDNFKDGLTDKRNTRLSLIGITFTILTSITVITGVTSFLVNRSGLQWGHYSRLIFIIASCLGVIAILLFALLRIRRE